MMYDFAESLKGHMYPYLPACFECISAVATDKHSSDGRASASQTLSKLFDAAVNAVHIGAAPSSFAVSAMETCIEKMLLVLRDEINAESRVSAAEAMRDILCSCYEAGGVENGDGSIPASFCKPEISSCATICAGLLECCQASLERRNEKETSIKRNEGLDDEDREALQEVLEGENDLLEILVDALGQLVKIHGPAFMPIFDSAIAPALTQYLAPNHPEGLQVVAVCMIDDAIEFGGSMAYKYIPQALTVFLKNISSKSALLRQCSTYGIAVSLRSCPDACMPSVGSILSALGEIISSASASAENEDNIGTTENALFALGTLCTRPEYRGIVGGNLETMVGLWLNRLPLTADERQAKTVHRELCSAIESGDSAVIGASYKHLYEIIRTLSAVCDYESKRLSSDNNENPCVAHAQTIQRMKSILKFFGGNSDPSVMQLVQSTYAGLSPDLQSSFQSAISS